LLLFPSRFPLLPTEIIADSLNPRFEDRFARGYGEPEMTFTRIAEGHTGCHGDMRFLQEPA
jgi:hypothetical protein